VSRVAETKWKLTLLGGGEVTDSQLFPFNGSAVPLSLSPSNGDGFCLFVDGDFVNIDSCREGAAEQTFTFDDGGSGNGSDEQPVVDEAAQQPIYALASPADHGGQVGLRERPVELDALSRGRIGLTCDARKAHDQPPGKIEEVELADVASQAAQFLGESAIGLAGLVEKYLDVRLEKKHQRADWAQRPLPPGAPAQPGRDESGPQGAEEVPDHVRCACPFVG
jgi:hypothetical protein